MRELKKTGILSPQAADTVSIGGGKHRVRFSAFIYSKGERSERDFRIALFFVCRDDLSEENTIKTGV